MTTFRPFQADRPNRLPEAGRIRLGQQVPTRTGGTRPAKLDTLRFTSPNQTAITALAALHGGTPKQWQNGNLQEWEVITTTNEIAVVLPPNPLGDTPIYELWDRGGLTRRCDGDTAIVPTRISDNEVSMTEHPCICNQQQKADCKPTTRLAVILPDIPFGGVWRLDTHSWNAADELPGMVAAIQNFTARGFVRAFLGVRSVQKMEAGKRKDFIVPYLRMDTSVSEALAGGAGLAAIPAVIPPAAALDAAPEAADNLIPVPEAKQRLLAALGGDKRAAAAAWATRFRVDAPPSNAVVEVEQVERLIAEHGIADAEVVDDDGRPFT